MTQARCLYEIYEVLCTCGNKYQVMVYPQEAELKAGHPLPIVNIPCPVCKQPAQFLGAHGVTVK